jgi:hypothetical protein
MSWLVAGKIDWNWLDGEMRQGTPRDRDRFVLGLLLLGVILQAGGAGRYGSVRKGNRGIAAALRILPDMAQ